MFLPPRDPSGKAQMGGSQRPSEKLNSVSNWDKCLALLSTHIPTVRVRFATSIEMKGGFRHERQEVGSESCCRFICTCLGVARWRSICGRRVSSHLQVSLRFSIADCGHRSVQHVARHRPNQLADDDVGWLVDCSDWWLGTLRIQATSQHHQLIL